MERSTVFQFDAAIVDKARQAFSARQGVADGFGELAFLNNKTRFCPEPGFESIDERSAFLLPDGATFVGAAATDVRRRPCKSG